MPIEVRELIIKANIVDDGKDAATSSGQTGTNTNVSANEELINNCVEKILEILKMKNDR